MDTTGTFEMFLECQKHNIIRCIHKHYNEMDWIKFINDNSNALILKNYLLKMRLILIIYDVVFIWKF